MMRHPLLCLLLAAVLALPSAAEAARKRKGRHAEREQAVSAEELLGADLAAAVEAAGAAYDKASAALEKEGRARRKNRNALLRRMQDVREDYAQALAQARRAKDPNGDTLLRDQVVVSITQSLRACDLITQGLRDDDEGPQETGVKLASLAQADLEALAAGGAPGAAADGGGGEARTPSAIGPSMGLDLGIVSTDSSFNMNVNANFSFPVARAVDLGVGVQLNGSSTDASGNVDFGGNVFTRYHFLDLFPARTGLVPYLGAKLGASLGTGWSGSGLNYDTTDSVGTNYAAQVGLLVFVNAKTAITVQGEVGRSNSSSTNASGAESTSSSGSTSFTVGFRKMF